MSFRYSSLIRENRRWEIAEMLVRSGAIDIIIIQTGAALVPEAANRWGDGDSHIGLQARLMSQALRKLTPVVSKSRCIVVFINQLRGKNRDYVR